MPFRIVEKTASSKGKNSRKPNIERRRWPRLEPSSVPFLKSVRFNQGTEVQVINISQGGILIETDECLRPQMEIQLKMVTNTGVVSLEGRIVRSTIVSLKGVPRYQSGIAFKHLFQMLADMSENPAGEPQKAQLESAASAVPQDGVGQPPLQPAADLESDWSSAFLTVFASDVTAMSSPEMLELNDW